MFNPLIDDISNLKDSDIELKIADLNKKYYIAAKMGNGGVCQQILAIIEQYKQEQQKRYYDKIKKVSVNKEDKDLNDLIKVQ